ncbi:MAG: hypothetical protein DMD38_14330 [Gemmatimonadetes bacterium]|nr:MAG: hypothetical protein AUI86_05750 [Gemmatimonadetes bacterium 13_1_40CM_3_66_12]PYP94837.1 MAG: hypothetical protein DMD38_14330 [Gemmatimonadota bacterium]
MSWRRLAIALSVFNVAGAGFAIASGEGWHAGIHVSLALAFGFAAQRLGGGRSGGGDIARMQQQFDEQATALEDAQTLLANQGAQLAELQERVDFAERMLAQLRDRQKLGSS